MVIKVKTMFSEMCDGIMIADNPLFGADPTALQLILYCDEFTVVNPLGSKVRKYNVGAFYRTRKFTIKVQNAAYLLSFFIHIICS